LSLDLENVQGQKNNLTNTDYGTCGRVHDGLAIALAECAVEAVAVVVCEVVAYEGLSTELVHSLKYLVCGGVSETGEERKESSRDRRSGSVSEDDLVEVGRVFNLQVL
jgi:hypothetical protein